MKTVVVAHRDDGDDGYVGERLLELGALLDRRWREEPETLDGAEDGADLIVLLGSDWSVYAEHVLGPVGAEQELVRRAARRGTPVLGICFGGQVLAVSLGLVVERAVRAEIGWYPIESDDPVLCPEGPWFQYHFDRWVDGGAISSFAHSPVGPQAFVHGRMLAVQFHPEVTPSTIDRWIHAVPGEVESAGAQIEAIEEATRGYSIAARERCDRLVDRFLSSVAGRPPAEVPLLG